MMTKGIGFLTLLIGLIAAVACLGCRGRPETRPVIESLAAPPPCVWEFTVPRPRSDKKTVHLYWFSPDGEIIETSQDDVLAFWSDGMLVKDGVEVDWLDFDPETESYVADPDADLTSWDTPVAVDPEKRIIYALAHMVAPSRKIEAHFLDGSEPEHVNQFTADEVETVDPLPNKGWTLIYVDRPGQATAATIDKKPTRRLRVYGGDKLGGEFHDVQSFFILEGCVVLNREEGWFLLEPGAGPMGVSNRTMSLSQIPGRPRPLARFEDTIVVASDELADDGETVTGCRLYTYHVYMRSVEEIWDSSEAGEQIAILSLAVRGLNDYLIVVGSFPESKRLTLGRLKDGDWSPLASADLPTPATSTEVFALGEVDAAPEEVQESVVRPEG